MTKNHLSRTLGAVALGIAASLLFSVSWEPSAIDPSDPFFVRLASDFAHNLTLSGQTVVYAVVFCAAFLIRFPARLGLSKARQRAILCTTSVVLSCAWALGMLYHSAYGSFDGYRTLRALVTFSAYLVTFYHVARLVCTFVPPPPRTKKAADHRHGSTRLSLIWAWVIIFACWVPYLVFLYPGICAPNDTLDSLQQYAGMESFTSTMAGQVQDGVYLNNHHPVVYTLLLGSFFFAGEALGSANLGMLALVVVQALALSCVLAASAQTLGKITSRAWRGACIAFFALNPVFPLIATCLTKDVPFTVAFIASLLLILKVLLGENTAKENRVYLGLAVAACAAVLLRSTALYVLVLWMICWAPFLLKRHKRLLASAAAGLVAALIVTQCVYPVCGIAPGSKGEALAVPFNQVARVVVEHEEELGADELAAVEAVLGEVDGLDERYSFLNADPVKNARDLQASTEDLAAFITTWARLGLEYPASYAKAWAGLCAGYFSPLVNDSYIWTLSFGYTEGADPDAIVDQTAGFQALGLNVSQEGAPTSQRLGAEELFSTAQDAPIGLLFNMGAYFFVLVLCLARCAYLGRKRACVATSLVVILAATFLLSPADNLLRYFLPCFAYAPLAIALAFKGQGPAKSGIMESESHGDRRIAPQ